jgi:dTDP-4-amino-4,6-dideoxygalactose transaminase
MSERDLPDIAVFGAAPAFPEPLHVGQLYLPEWKKTEEMFRGIFRRRYFTNHGPLVKELDRRFAEHLGVAHAVGVTNGTVALMVAIQALELRGEVIVPAFTFPATVQSLTWAGLTPVFCDVDPATHNINAILAEPLITPRTSAILGVHLWGRACDPDGLTALCVKRGLSLLYDAAHAIDCSHAGRKIGGFGRVETFSFHATKVLNGAEGGCLTTNDGVLADRIRSVRNFHLTEGLAKVPLRINGKMTEAQAAMALLGLDDLADNIARNRAIWNVYKERAAAWSGVGFVDTAAGGQSNHQYVVLEVDPASPLTRDELLHLLRAENVLARRYFMPGVHRMPPYRDRFRGSLPATDALCQRLLQLPVGAAISVETASRIADLMDLFTSRGGRIAARLRKA